MNNGQQSLRRKSTLIPPTSLYNTLLFNTLLDLRIQQRQPIPPHIHEENHIKEPREMEYTVAGKGRAGGYAPPSELDPPSDGEWEDENYKCCGVPKDRFQF